MKKIAHFIRHSNPWFSVLMLVLFLLVGALTACSGGGGGSGSSAPAISYSGADTLAALTADNSNTLIEESFQGALTGDSMNAWATMSTVSDTIDEPMSKPIALGLQAAFAESITHVAGNTSKMQTAKMASQAYASETIVGDCGGSATFSANYDEATGIISGSFSYNAFCSGGVTISGNATFNGRVIIYGQSYEIDYFSFAFSSLTTTGGGESVTISGTLDCDFTDVAFNHYTISADFVMSQSSSGLVCWLNNYTIQVTGTMMEISGRFYHPVHGYIDFATSDTDPLRFYGGSDYPCRGTIIFTGAVGTEGQPTSAQLTALDPTYCATCQVTADFDGDGVRDDYDSGEILWEDL